MFVADHDIEETAFVAGAWYPLHDCLIGEPTQEWQVSLRFFEEDGGVVFDPLESQSLLVNPMILGKVVLCIDGGNGREGVSVIPDHRQVRDGVWTADLHGAPQDTDSRNLLEHPHRIWNMLDTVGGIDLCDDAILDWPRIVGYVMLDVGHGEFVQVGESFPARLYATT